MTTLHIKDGPLAGQTIEMQGDLTIGREGCDLTIAGDGDLSRRHAIVRRIAEGLEVEDLGSKNGTFVDGRRIDTPTHIGDGMRLELGATVLEVHPGPNAPATSPSSRDTDARAGAVPAMGAGPETNGAAEAAVSPATAAAVPAAAAVPMAPAGRPAAPLVPLAAPNATPIGVFHPPSRRRGRLATRSLVPVLLSFGTSVLTAVALVIYFAAR